MKPVVHPPWCCALCLWPAQAPALSPPTAVEQICGCMVGRAARQPFTRFDTGEPRPFLPSNVTSEPTDLPAPPAPPAPGRFVTSYGVHSPCCFGTCLVAGATGGDRLLWATAVFLLVPTALFAVFAAPAVRDEFGMAALSVVFAFAASAFVFLAATYLTEPGILPTLSFQESAAEDAPTHVFVHWQGRYYDRRVFRAQKSRFTSSMIEGFDHYCPWVSNAIAKRNYRYFMFFLASCFLLSALACAACVGVLVKRAPHKHWWKVLETEPASALIGAYAFVFAASLSSLLWYHVKLVSRGLSTSEEVKNRFPRGNPYALSCVDHWALLCCGPHWPSRVAEGASSASSASSAEVHDLTSLLLSPSASSSRTPPIDNPV